MPKHETFERRSSDPTPAQIQERAAMIRRQWSKRIMRRRRVSIPPAWRPPTIPSREWGQLENDDFNDAA